MKDLVFALCLYQVRWVTEAGVPDASKTEQIPLEAQALSGLPLVEYLQKNQDLFEVQATPVPNFEQRLMNLKYKDQSNRPVQEDVEDIDDDIPESDFPKGQLFQKYLVFALCFYLGGWVTGAEIHDASEAEQIPLEAQALSGLPLVEYLQKNQDLFEVQATPVPNFEQRLMNLKYKDQGNRPVQEDVEDIDDDIPESYDPRIQWANCSSLFHIRDQANCGSCWAVSTAAAMSDRICIASADLSPGHGVVLYMVR
ncbi:hypothetical protein TELCIR_07071 [Teladorsagia circumcincta]|uniref:Peptidase C1A papain C-terminal domain-containing protein n=1 Tax=Teladorsagia circumcincta TaxID=45464 RepID=A0A2G9ULD8_TELCI|nr:hypothetical protein TELCIR_07071 [Teladorsagia circumcincta]